MNAKSLSKLCAPCLAILLAAATGCSYVVDAVEAQIMNRASFSITVTDNHNGTVTVDWEDIDDLDSGAFAGYEIYVTDTPNDEFAGYRVIAAEYSLSSSTDVDSGLHYDTTRSATVNFTPNSAGDVYYFRVAAIYWDEEKESDREKNWTFDKVGHTWTSSYPDSENRWFYENKSGIDKVSGGLRVQF